MTSDDKLLKDFFESRGLRSNTIRSYKMQLNKYSQSTGMTLTQLIEEAEGEEEKRVRMRRRGIKKHLSNFYNELVEKGYSPLSIKTIMGIVKGFYHEYDIETPKQRIRTNRNGREMTEEIPTKEDIQTVLSIANPKYQAIILLMVSSGMGSAEVRSLTVRDFLNALKLGEVGENDPIDIYQLGKMWEEKQTIPTWIINRIKTGMPYFTFSTLESIYYIFRYLKITPPQSLDDPLFVAQGGGFMGESGFSKYFHKLNQECGWEKAFFKSHKLRKYFGTTLIKAKINKLEADWLLGHRIDPTTEAYFKATVYGLKRDYMSVVNLLTFLEDVKTRLVTDERLQEMEDKMARMEEKLRMYGEREDKLGELPPPK